MSLDDVRSGIHMRFKLISSLVCRCVIHERPHDTSLNDTSVNTGLFVAADFNPLVTSHSQCTF